MNVKRLKEILEFIPDDYEIRSRSENAHLNNDEKQYNLNFMGILETVKIVDIHKTVVFIRGHE